MQGRTYLIVDDVTWLERLLPLGVRLVQLRMKDRPADELRRQAIRAKALCARAGATLVLNDYWQLAIETGIDFVHLGQEDLDGADLPALRRAGIRLGISTHDHAELERALAIDPHHLALGPIFPTILKSMRFAPQGIARITEWKRRVGDKPLVAIGGLTPERGATALAAGADHVAVVTDVLLAPSPEARLRQWLEATGELSAAAS